MNQPQLKDDSPMPFGKHKGHRMEDVPAQYLNWLWCNGKKTDRSCLVADYIRRNINVLKHEFPDGDWDEQ
jgi:hypothetical protein